MGSSLVLKIGKIEIWKSKGLQPYNGQVRFLGANIVWSDGTRERFVNAYLTNSGVYSVVSYIADLAGSCPFQVYKVKDAKLLKRYKVWTGRNATSESLQKALLIKEKVFELDEVHPINKLIEKPNEWQNQSQFVANSVGIRLLTGERMVLPQKLNMGANEGKPYSLVNLPPQYMGVVGDGTMFGISGFELNMGTGQKFKKEEIIYDRMWTPEFGTSGEQLRGLSPLKAGLKDVDRYDQAQARSAAMLKNQGASGMVYDKQVDGLTPEQAGELKVKLNTEVLGTENVGKIALFNGEAGYINFGLSTKDLGTEELENLSFRRICNVYHVPYRLFDNDSSGLSNAKEFKKEMITMAVIPQLVSVRDTFNTVATLYGDDSIYIDYDVSVYPEMQEDLEKTATVLDKCWFFSGDEKRVKMGADQTGEPMMQKFFIDSNKVDVESLDINLMDEAINGAIADASGSEVSPPKR